VRWGIQVNGQSSQRTRGCAASACPVPAERPGRGRLRDRGGRTPWQTHALAGADRLHRRGASGASERPATGRQGLPSRQLQTLEPGTHPQSGVAMWWCVRRCKSAGHPLRCAHHRLSAPRRCAAARHTVVRLSLLPHLACLGGTPLTLQTRRAGEPTLLFTTCSSYALALEASPHQPRVVELPCPCLPAALGPAGGKAQTPSTNRGVDGAFSSPGKFLACTSQRLLPGERAAGPDGPLWARRRWCETGP
jgi:hypothetical protein